METLNLREINSQEEHSTTFDNVAEGNMIRVYPYKMVNAAKDKAMIKPDTLSVIAISNKASDFDETKVNLKQDENGFNYFEMFAAVSADGDIISHLMTSSIGNQYKEIKSFIGITNQWEEQNSIQPCLFFINEPFHKDDFDKDEQIAYIAEKTDYSAPEVYSEKYQDVDFDTEFKVAELTLRNVKDLEAAFPNSRITLTTNVTLRSVNDFSMYIPTSMLIAAGGIKLKGTYSKKDDNDNIIYTAYGDIDVRSLEKWAPFKMTPTSTSEKVTMYADWFDYDSVLPFVYANKFNDGAGLEVVITNEDDRKMVEDMLAISAGFAENWKRAPVLTTGADAGKIDPNYRVGHKGIKITTIANIDPVKVVDGIYEDHIREHPAFLTDITRYQPTKEIINALSRYIYSSYAIGKGQNSYNMAYLPWYLEPSNATPIKFGKAETIQNPDFGATNQVTTYVMNDGVKFQIKTLYFTDKFGDKIPTPGQKTPKLPHNVNFSNQIMLQTDRKLTLPEVPRVISAMDKLPLPGDINTRSTSDLSYIWMLPIQDQAKFEEFMLNTLSSNTPVPIGTDITVNIPTTKPADIWDQAKADAYVLSKVPGTIKTHSVLTQREVVVSTGHTIKVYSGRGGTYATIDDHQIMQSLSPSDPQAGTALLNYICAWFGINKDRDKYELVTLSSSGDGYGNTNVVKLITHYTEFTPAIVTTTSALGSTSFSFQGREVLFDKEQWENFLVSFNLSPRGENWFFFSARDEKVAIEEIEEITVTAMWGDKIRIWLGGSHDQVIEVEMNNRDDETITIQRILLA